MSKALRLTCAIGALTALILLATGCSVVRINRTYDEAGIKKEVGFAWGFYDESTGKFNMTRHDQRGENDYVTEGAGANYQWTHEAGAGVTRKGLSVLELLGSAYLASQGVPMGLTMNNPDGTTRIQIVPPPPAPDMESTRPSILPPRLNSNGR